MVGNCNTAEIGIRNTTLFQSRSQPVEELTRPQLEFPRIGQEHPDLIGSLLEIDHRKPFAEQIRQNLSRDRPPSQCPDCRILTSKCSKLGWMPRPTYQTKS